MPCLYLAEKTGKFLPHVAGHTRRRCCRELMFFRFPRASATYSGQAVRVSTIWPRPKDYAVNRYSFEAQRLEGSLLEERLGKHGSVRREAYTIVRTWRCGGGRA